jgi:hypothetical protein
MLLTNGTYKTYTSAPRLPQTPAPPPQQTPTAVGPNEDGRTSPLYVVPGLGPAYEKPPETFGVCRSFSLDVWIVSLGLSYCPVVDTDGKAGLLSTPSFSIGGTFGYVSQGVGVLHSSGAGVLDQAGESTGTYYGAAAIVGLSAETSSGTTTTGNAYTTTTVSGLTGLGAHFGEPHSTTYVLEGDTWFSIGMLAWLTSLPAMALTP